MPRQPRTSIDMAILKRQLTLRDDVINKNVSKIQRQQRELAPLQEALAMRSEDSRNNDLL